MHGIKYIGSYLGEIENDNMSHSTTFNFDKKFLTDRLGVLKTYHSKLSTTNLCVKSFDTISDCIDVESIDLVIVVTQNPDQKVPHTSAILQHKLNLPKSVIAFDVSLGCSGYPYALSIVTSLLCSLKLNNALIFTCDPYSKIIDPSDKNTSLLFSDAATCTLITNNKPILIPYKYSFGTDGAGGPSLCTQNNILHMNGRDVFNFAAKTIPSDITQIIKSANLTLDCIDSFILHQGSLAIVDTIKRRLGIAANKVPYDILNYGNTVSSSIPILLEKVIQDDNMKNILISGFGVGLSWSSSLLRRHYDNN